MRKTILSLAVVALAMASCTTQRNTSTTMDVSTSLRSAATSDLVVSDSKLTYTLRPAKKVRRGGLRNICSTAVAEALKSNGGGDVLVHPQYEVVTRRGLFGKKVKSVTVSGYPGTYRNFKVKDCKGTGCQAAPCHKQRCSK